MKSYIDSASETFTQLHTATLYMVFFLNVIEHLSSQSVNRLPNSAEYFVKSKNPVLTYAQVRSVPDFLFSSSLPNFSARLRCTRAQARIVCASPYIKIKKHLKAQYFGTELFVYARFDWSDRFYSQPIEIYPTK